MSWWIASLNLGGVFFSSGHKLFFFFLMKLQNITSHVADSESFFDASFSELNWHLLLENL